MSPNEVRSTSYGDFQAAFRGWQLSQGIDPEEQTRGRIRHDDLKSLMARFPDEVMH